MNDLELDLRVVGEADDKTVRQMENCIAAEAGAIGVLLPDNHLGYSQPIGGAVAYRQHVSPSGVGYDIGCGNKAVLTDLTYGNVADSLPEIMDRIEDEISFGVGRKNNEPVDHPVLDKIKDAPFEGQRPLYEKAAAQLGTVGAGNHYVDLFRDEHDRVWIGVHFGSRGFGHTTAEGFLAVAQGLPFSRQARKDRGLAVVDGEMMSPPVLFDVDSAEGQAYIEAMTLAGEYAYAGRDVVCTKVLQILGAHEVDSVHNHHNFAWHEEHGGEQFWVVRKGCTPAFPGQRGFVGATMGETSVILEGTEYTADALFSTVHGAGRVMSRTRAAGKQRKRWSCTNRDCDWYQPPHTHKPEDGNCPQCGHDKLKKRLVQMTPGEINWEQERFDVEEFGVHLRGGAADEAPGAYKRLHHVLAAQADAILVRSALQPIGVCMAPAETFDPYKD